MSLKIMGLITILASTSAWAGNFTGKPVGPIMPDGHVGLARPVAATVKAVKNGIVQHKASGEHICWSDIEIGRSCTVEGINYLDCHRAFYALKADDCCTRMFRQIFGKTISGNSRDFVNFKCGKML